MLMYYIIVFLSYTVCLLQASLNQGPGVCILGPLLLDMEQAVGQLSYKLSRFKAVLSVKLKTGQCSKPVKSRVPSVCLI